MTFLSALFMFEVSILHRQRKYLLGKYIKHGMSSLTVHRMCIFPVFCLSFARRDSPKSINSFRQMGRKKPVFCVFFNICSCGSALFLNVSVTVQCAEEAISWCKSRFLLFLFVVLSLVLFF